MPFRAGAQVPRGHNSHVDGERRDIAVVLSGGGINGVLLELGFLRRLRETPLWERIGWIYGTSAGALSGTMAALDRLDDLEEFLLDLQPADVFRPRRMWQFAGGLHDYTLPATIAARLGGAEELGTALVSSPIELVVFATDVSIHEDGEETRHYELAYSSRSTEAETMGRALLASAAVSGLVLPVSVDGVIATDGGWVRNFPLEHAYRNPDVSAIAAFRFVASYRPTDVAFLERMRERLERFRAVPPVRALLGEIRLAEERVARGRAGALRRAHRPAHARRHRPEHGARGAACGRAGDVRRGAPPAARGRRHARPCPRRRAASESACARSSTRSSPPPTSPSATIATSRPSSSARIRATKPSTRRSRATSPGPTTASKP